MSITNSLGRVMPVDKGAYNEATNYDRLDMVHTADSTYVSLVDDNVGNPVTDTTKWQCYADGKPATAAAATATAAAGNATAAAAAANAAAGRAPYIGSNEHWYIWSAAQAQYIDTGVDASAPVLTIDDDYTIRKDGAVFTEAIKNAAEQAEADHAQYEIDHASIANKANIDGYYSTLTAGAAENLVGRGSVPATYLRRTAGGTADIGSGAAMINKFKGKTLVWNQLVKNGGFTSDASWSSGTQAIMTIANGEATVVAKPNMGPNFELRQPSFPAMISSHKYNVAFEIKANFTAAIRCYTYIASEEVILTTITPTSEYQRKNVIITNKEAPTGLLRFNIVNSTEVAYDEENPPTFWVRNVKITDLTLMFGAGNEPATVEEFEALFPLPYYDYDAGRLLNVSATGIVTEGFNQYDPVTGKAQLLGGNQYQLTGTYTGATIDGEDVVLDAEGCFTPSADSELVITGGNDTDTCVHLVWSGYRNGEYEKHWQSTLNLPITTMTGKLNGEGESVVIFPNGMKGDGTVYDELVVDADGYARKVTQRFRRLAYNLQERTWGKTTATSGMTFFFFDIGSGYTSRDIAFLTNLPYAKVKALNGDQQMALWFTTGGNMRFGVVDSRYDTVEAFTEAMAGYVYIPELYNYSVYILDEPIYMGYRVDDFGTEAVIPANGSTPTTAPVSYDVTYAMNAVDIMRRLPETHISAESFQNFAAALLSAGIIGSITLSYNPETRRYDFTVTAPEDTDTTDNTENS